jgi:hypothetical protein
VHRSALPPIEIHHPATFRSRGLAVPFTTPLLAGARVREPKRSGVELVVPNPSGGRGVYVVQWPGVRVFCNPTVHDTVLFQRVAGLQRFDPAAAREAALDVALSGYAGRDAMAAARSVRGSDQGHRMLTDFLLLAGLLEQVEPSGCTVTRLAERTADFDQRAGLVLRRIAPAFGCAAAHLTDGVAALGGAFASIGVTQNDQTARVPRLIGRLKETQAELSRWLGDDPRSDIGGLGRVVTATMKGTIVQAEVVLTSLRSAATDPTALLKRWVAHASDPVDLAARCDWLLDGWERICLVWKTATSMASRRAALLEMAQLLPVLPREISDWVDGPVPPEITDEACRVVSGNDAWRSGGAAFGLIQRNELLRALSW